MFLLFYCWWWRRRWRWFLYDVVVVAVWFRVVIVLVPNRFLVVDNPVLSRFKDVAA